MASRNEPYDNLCAYIYFHCILFMYDLLYISLSNSAFLWRLVFLCLYLKRGECAITWLQK